MEQTKALNALEPFLALSKTATSPRAAADLVTRATSNANTFVFTELLHTPQVQSLSRSPEFAPHLRLLQIFSYGTYADYQRQASSQQEPALPALNEAQTLKIRQLSLLTLARDRSNLSYPTLCASLSLPDARSLEALVTSAIYAGLLSATLDPARQHVRVSALSPLRDLAPGSVPALSSALGAWSDRCESTLADLEAQMADVRAQAARRQRESAANDRRIAQLVAEYEKKATGADPATGGVGAGTGTTLGDRTRRPAASRRNRGMNKRGSNLMDQGDEVDDEAMDVDIEEEETKRASRRKL